MGLHATRGSKHACSRCTKHKKKCHPVEGPCTNCVRAGIECTRTEDRLEPRSTKRSIVEPLHRTIQHLRGEIEELQTRDAEDPAAKPSSGSEATDHGSMVPQSAPSSPIPCNLERTSQNQRYQFGLETAAEMMQLISPDVQSRAAHVAFLRRLRCGAELPFPLTFRFKDGSQTPTIVQKNSKPLSCLPREITDRLLQIYIQRVLPQCPIFSPAEIRAKFDKIHAAMVELRSPPKGEMLVMFMVMAIATLVSKSDNYREGAELTEAFRMEGQRLDDEDAILATTSTRCLQGLLLLAQYGLLMPQKIDLWHTASDAMRVAMELGLHTEPPKASNMCLEIVQEQRRLFWVTYSLERSIALTCHRPFAIRDDQIKLKEFPMTQSSETSILTWGSSVDVARYLNHLAYCMLQSEISFVNIGNEPIPSTCSSYTEWVASCVQRIDKLRGGDWQETVLIPDWHDMPAWRCLAWLYMPCPKNPSPSDETLTKFVHALVHILEAYWDLAQKTTVSLCWSAVHHAYEVGTQLLYCMQNYPHIVQACYDTMTILDSLTHLSDFFVLMEEQWPASAQCKVLLGKLRKNVIDIFLRGPSPSSLSKVQSDEQRIIDVIFRKNAWFFFATQEPFDFQYYLLDPLLESNLDLPLDVATCNAGLEELLSMQPHLMDAFTNPSPDLLNSSPTLQIQIEQPSLTSPSPNNSFPDPNFSLPQPSSNANVSNPVGNRNEAPTNGGYNKPYLSVSPEGVPASASSLTISAESRRAEWSSATQDYVNTCIQTLARLPVCTPCRLRRVKCSRDLPSCHNCLDYGRNCVYADPASGESVDAKYLFKLQKDISKLLSRLDEAFRVPEKPEEAVEESIVSESPSRGESDVLLLAYETSIGPSTCYWGESSVLGQIVSTSSLKCRSSDVQRSRPAVAMHNQDIRMVLRSLSELPQDSILALTERYCQKSETFLPVLGRTRIAELVACIKTGKQGPVDQGHADILLNLVVAIALALPFSQRSGSFSMSYFYYENALSFVSTSNSLFLTSSIESLQVALLTCIYVMLHPAAGTLSRLINSACRVCLDLLESQDLSTEATATAHSLFRTAYILDTDIAIAFGRPNFLPEWKMPGTMILDNTTDEPHPAIALLAYDSAKLRSTIHNTIIGTFDQRSRDDASTSCLVTSLKVQLDNWWDEWRLEASNYCQHTGLSTQSMENNGPFQYGSFAYFKTATLLHLLSKVHGTKEPDIQLPTYSNSIIETHATYFHESNAMTVDYDFPVFWNHYIEILGAGLELISSEDALSSTNQTLLHRCFCLLELFERSIGSREWTLSSRLRVLISQAC